MIQGEIPIVQLQSQSPQKHEKAQRKTSDTFTDGQSIPHQQLDNNHLNEQQQQNMGTQAVKLQKSIRAFLIRQKLKIEFKKIHQRKSIIKELLQTEQGYIRDLGFIVSDFNKRMSLRKILTEQQCKKLFSNVDNIRGLHDIFYSTLYQKFSNFHPYSMIFKDILDKISFFKIYIEYLNNFPTACDLVEQYKRTKPAFAAFVADISKSPLYRHMSLQDFIIMPIQRLPRYCLLLKQIIKNTAQSHPDYQNVSKALKGFQQVNNSNNQKLQKIRNNYRLRELEHMLQLPDEIITPSTQFILEECVQIISQQNNQVLSNCVIYLLNSAVIVTKRVGISRISTRMSTRNTLNANTHSARISRASGGFGSALGLGHKEKLQAIVPIKYGTSIKFNKDQHFFKNTFTIQSNDGESCTIVCSNQQQLHNLSTKIRKQCEAVKQQTMSKIKTMFQSESATQNSTFIKNLSLLDLVPEVTVLGTSERMDKMLKYTVYIIEVKVKMIRQKIFLRFSELLQLQKFINTNYLGKITIKQGLVNSSWLNNHQQKTIQQRKMNIQRFLKQILSKPEVIENGWKILLRLGLPMNFYELPNKLLQNKNAESFIKKSGAFGKSTIVGNFKKRFSKAQKTSPTYRLSLFQQQKIQQQQNQSEDSDSELQQIIKQSIHQEQQQQSQQANILNPKSSYGSTQQSQTLCIQDILKANQIDLGHYTLTNRVSEDMEQYENQQRLQSHVQLEILVPCLEQMYHQSIEGGSQKNGYKTVTIKIGKIMRVHNIIPLVKEQIKLKYYKDFRLVLQKQYSSRVLDDDEIVHKLISQINRTKSMITFKKVIYIDHNIQEKQLTADKERMMIQASQIIKQIKMGKYRLNYESYLKFAVLSAIVYQESLPINQQANASVLNNLAKQAKDIIFPKYSSLSQTQSIWISDFKKGYQIIKTKLEEITHLNDQQIQQQKQRKRSQQNQNFGESDSFFLTNSSYWANTNVKYLAMLSIVKEMERKQMLYGCMTFSVQISDEFKKFLEQEITLGSFHSWERNKSLQNSQKNSKKSSTRRISFDDVESYKRISDQENKNCWLAIRHDKVILTSISKNNILFELSYENIVKIQPYASAVIFLLRNSKVSKIKLKTTSSFYIRQMMIYYRNYRNVLKKIYHDNQYKESVLQIGRDGQNEKMEMDEVYL